MSELNNKCPQFFSRMGEGRGSLAGQSDSKLAPEKAGCTYQGVVDAQGGTQDNGMQLNSFGIRISCLNSRGMAPERLEHQTLGFKDEVLEVIKEARNHLPFILL